MEEVEILENINPFIKFDAPIHEMIKSYGIPEYKTKKIIKKFKKHHVEISNELYNYMNSLSENMSRENSRKNSESRNETTNRSKLSELIDYTFLQIILNDIKNESKNIKKITLQNTYEYVDYTNWIDYRLIITDKLNKKYILWLDLKNGNNDTVEEKTHGYMWKFISLLYNSNWELWNTRNIIDKIKHKSKLVEVEFNRYEFNINWFNQRHITQIILDNYNDKKRIKHELVNDKSVNSEYVKIKNQLSEIIKEEISWKVDNQVNLVRTKADDIIENDDLSYSKSKPKSKTQQNLDEQRKEERRLKEKRIKKVNSSNKNKQKPFVLLDKMEDILNWKLWVAVFIKSIWNLKSSLKTKVINDIITMFDWIDRNQIAIKKWASTITKFMDKKQIKKINNLKKQFFVKFWVKSDERSA